MVVFRWWLVFLKWWNTCRPGWPVGVRLLESAQPCRRVDHSRPDSADRPWTYRLTSRQVGRWPTGQASLTHCLQTPYNCNQSLVPMAEGPKIIINRDLSTSVKWQWRQINLHRHAADQWIVIISHQLSSSRSYANAGWSYIILFIGLAFDLRSRKGAHIAMGTLLMGITWGTTGTL